MAEGELIMMRPDEFRISEPAVTEVDASWNGAGDHHVLWAVDYAPETEDNERRVVFGALQVGSEAGQGNITVAAMLADGYGAINNPSDFESALTQSEAIRTLYDFARTSLRPVLAIVDADGVIPVAAPVPNVTQLVPSESASAKGGTK